MTINAFKYAMMSGCPVCFRGGVYSAVGYAVRVRVEKDGKRRMIPQGEILDKSGNAVLVVSIDEVEMEEK
nr:MAG TPA: hypothetical protein [Caudoviricetes sp.]